MYINESARRTRRKGIQGPKNTYRGMANIRKTPGESEWAPALEQVNINRSGNAAEVTFPDLDSQKQHTGENRPLAAENWEASAVAERCEGHDGLPTGFSAELSKMEMETRNLEASIKQHTAVIAMHMATHDTHCISGNTSKGRRKNCRTPVQEEELHERNGNFRFAIPSAIAVEAGARSSTIHSTEIRNEDDQNCASPCPRSEYTSSRL